MKTADLPLKSDSKPNVRELITRVTQPPPTEPQVFVYKGQSTQDLHRAARLLYNHLSRTADPAKPICLCTENRELAATALMASLMGAPPLILPHAYSAQALDEVHKAVEYDWVLSDVERPLPNKVFRVSPQWNDKPDSGLAQINPKSENTTWIYLFTGGSTGQPQIWSKTPTNLLCESADQISNFEITPQDTILATVPPNHIYGLLYSVLIPLLSGARVVGHTPTFPSEMVGSLERTKATVLISIPLHFRALNGYPIPAHSLRMAMSSAGPLAQEDGRAFFEATGVTVLEGYGSTETGGIAVSRDKILKHFGSIRIKIDQGQLWVSSPYLSPELETDAQGYYKTADRVASQGAQGFTLLGRADGIVKIGGKRVDLTHIQEVIKKLSDVKDVFVFSEKPQKDREKVIHAVVQGELTREELQTHLQNDLDAHCHPKRLRIVKALPRTRAGKYDRRAIQDLFEAPSD